MDIMSFGDKAKNATEKMAGQMKEGAGKVSDDEKLEQEGRADQAKADLKQAGEKLKDTFNN